MPKIYYVYQKREQKLATIHIMKIDLKNEVKKMFKDELTEDPRWGQNVIDKVNLKICFPVLAFKRRSEVCFVMFQVNKYI